MVPTSVPQGLRLRSQEEFRLQDEGLMGKLPEDYAPWTNIAMENPPFDGIYQERWGCSWSMFQEGYTPDDLHGT